MTNKKILFVEGDAETVKLLSIRLKSEQYDFIVKTDALQGMRCYFEDKPDLIIANARVPGGGALAIHKQIQERGDFTTPVIYLADSPDAAIRKEAEVMGAASFHTKPLDLEDLLSEVQRILTSPTEAARVVADRRTMRVLIVDDEEEHCEIIQGCLQEKDSAPWEIVWAHTVADARRELRAGRFDCILLDHNLPDGHGCDVLEQEEDRLLTIPVIGLSTSQEPEIAVAEFRGGCIDFLPKRDAFKGKVLRRRIAEALSKCNRRMIATVMEHRQRDRAWGESEDVMERTARMDALMGIWNRGAFDDYHAAVHESARNAGSSYVIMLADVDNFKKYNDAYGHMAGDEVLKAVAKAIKNAVRDDDSVDFVARYGGEELVVLSEQVEPEVVFCMADRLKTSVWNLNILHERNEKYGRVTISVGVALLDVEHPESPVDILARADSALCEAKEQGGRNTCKLSQRPHAMEMTDA
jgi:two-component system chemotaxis family response regulator WspR